MQIKIKLLAHAFYVLSVCLIFTSTEMPSQLKAGNWACYMPQFCILTYLSWGLLGEHHHVLETYMILLCLLRSGLRRVVECGMRNGGSHSICEFGMGPTS